MNYDPNVPIWLQVATALKTELVTGKRPPGEKLPGGRELALAFSINPNTAARVYRELEREGLCETRRGLGTFVTADAGKIAALRREMAGEAVDRLLDWMAQLGYTPAETVRMIEQKEGISCSKAET